MKDAFRRDADDVLRALDVSPEEGLAHAEVERRREKHGPNELPAAEATPFLTLVLKQFEDLLVLILLAAAAVSFGLAMLESGDDFVRALMEPAVILLILIANAIVGVLQETSAENSINALRKSEARHATVYREGGALETVPASTLVPGDVIEVDVGAKVPADCRVLRVYTATLSVDEAMLTGENVPSQKTPDTIDDAEATTGDKHNMLFSGTLVVRGKALAVVTEIGGSTAMGEIAKSLDEEEDEKTPLQLQLDDFGEQLSKIIAIICIVVILINVNHFGDEEHGGYVKGMIYYFKIGVALAVAAIPEGLPAVVTTCLALGTMKMARKNAIVRSLPSVETLGCTTVICSDKTGTLTTNMMSVQRVLAVRAVNASEGTATFRSYAVEGDSFAPYGRVLDASNDTVLPAPAVQDPALAAISRVCALCNESTLQYEEEERGKGVYGKSGTPTEAALKVLAEKLGCEDEAATDRIFQSRDPLVRVSAVSSFYADQFRRERLLEFSRDRKSMSVVVRPAGGGGSSLLLCKGAPEGVLERCTRILDSSTGRVESFTGAMRARVEDEVAEMASRGLRCLALAYLEDPEEDQEWADLASFADIESDMVFVGVVGMMDPPRPEVADAIRRCRQAHIRVIVITGDHKTTAETICRMIGVFDENESTEGRSFTGAEFNKMSEEEQDRALRRASLFSRVEPKHKHRLLTILKNQGEVTAMTGDGVNDAPALKAAHIGVAMGSGTDVAREASDMVLADDNFSTIVMAVEEGRAIYANACAFIRYLISSNIGEVACIFLQAALGIPEALIPVQLLWVNLVTDGLPATALGFNEADKDVMLKPPRDRKQGIISGWVFIRYMVIGLYIGVATVAGFMYWFQFYEGGPQITFKQLSNFHACDTNTDLYPEGFDCAMFHAAAPSTVALSILVTIEMLNAANAISENQSLFVVPVWRNMWLVLAIALSFALHLGIVYIPTFADIFSVSPISWEEWKIVWACSLPVLLLDEVLKFIGRSFPEASPAKKSAPKRSSKRGKKAKRA